MERSAKQLCAMLITRSLAGLTEEEEDIVVDYLDNLGIDVDIDAKPRDICVTLLNKTMETEIGRRISLTPYANQILGKQKLEEDERLLKREEGKLERNRTRKQLELEKKYKTLPGCIPDDNNLVSRNLYQLRVDENVGVRKLVDGTYQYAAVVSVPSNMYQRVFLNISDPVLEITTNKGYKGYVRIDSAHENNDIRISPLVGAILKVDNVSEAFLKLCIHLPRIKKIDFTFYGSQSELDSVLSQLLVKLPSVINAFSYLSLGLVLKTEIDGKPFSVRVDGLLDDEVPIFAGLIPPGESDIPFFDISADQ